MAAMAPPRESWTDERLDDLKGHMDEGFREVRTELRQIRGELGQQSGEMARQKEMDARFEAVDKRFDDVNRTLQIGFGIIGGIMAAMLTLMGVILTKL